MIIGSVNSFLYCCYLEKVRESKDRVFYKKLKKRAYIHPGSMFCADVPLDEENMSVCTKWIIYSYANSLQQITLYE